VSLSLCLDPAGDLVLLQGQQGDSRTFRLPIPALVPGETVVATLNWDAPARCGTLSAWLPDRPALLQAPVAAPLPLPERDAARIVTDREACRLAPGVVFCAIADAPAATGPVAGVNPGARVAVPGGTVAAGDLRPGDILRLHRGGIARVVWAGRVERPARGRTAPLFLRAPYHGLGQDILASADTALRLSGSEIEYLFGQEIVACPVRLLADQHAVISPPDMAIVRYAAVLVDRPGALIVGGAAIEPLDAAPLGADPALWSLSVAGRMPPGWQAPAAPPGCPRLRAHEARSLRRRQAA
jgi:hypothetical protein